MRIKLIALVILSIGLFSFADTLSSYYPKSLQRKIDRQIKKTFDIKSFSNETVDLEIVKYSRELFRVKNVENIELGYNMVTLANACKLGGCLAPKPNAQGEHEQFYFSTLYSPSGTILNIRILDYDSDYGYAMTARSWLKQFIGKKGGSLKVDKDIDGISGATISVNSLVKEINFQQQYIDTEDGMVDLSIDSGR